MTDMNNGMFWWVALLTVLAVTFVLWPFIFSKKNRQRDAEGVNELERVAVERIALNNALYQENLDDIQQQLSRGEINADEAEKMQTELASQLQQDNAIESTTDTFGFLSGRGLIIASAILAPLVALGLYWDRGFYPDWEIDQLIKENDRLFQREATQEQQDFSSKKLLSKLEARLKHRPDNLNNQIMLARTAFELREFQTAIKAYQVILDERPNSPQVMAELAQTIFISSGNRFLAPVKELFDRALKIEPNNVQILSLAGYDAYSTGDFTQAIAYWEVLIKALPPTDPRYSAWQQLLAEAKKSAGLADNVAATPSNSTSPSTSSSETSDDSAPFINVSVALGDSASAEVASSDTVFIYARAANGPRMPLAMQRVTVADLPIQVRLDESTSMAAGMTIKQFPSLEVLARVSKSGNASSQSGDWQAISSPVSSAPNQSVELVINTKIP